ncbi:ubiquitin-conjugating enzyme/RWD-like protein [Zychaea mexicana]|uniref:ubiquitin-conjugating enzyme/RWD-like protein n=1 Tax=Zychaea mexicana TaxID=64656 RepID=UPI0022FE3BE9|nr:ubiquitin-conjugating enzyme/RWD-like protein [Zychaea mexicana]KAI9496761.1 ubiquitin-conjugating enzyme/RWD-like protein [Zychaea mexicana]
MYLQRIQRDVEAVYEDGCFGLKVTDNPALYYATIKGPADTPYSGGVFLLRIEFPDDYPFKPIKAQFISKVYHPNISSQTGAICLDILADMWSPAITLRIALHSLQALLDKPGPDDPIDAVVAKHYRDDHAGFVETAQEWTRRFAKGDEQIKEYVVCRIKY